MRASNSFFLPHKKPVGSSRSTVTKLLVEGGFVRRISDGLFAYLPLGMTVLRNIGQLFAQEMKKLGGQELLLPVLGPQELWDHSDESDSIAQEFLMVNDRQGRTLALAPRHDDLLVSVAKDLFRDDSQFPSFFFQTQVRLKDPAATNHGITNTIVSVVSDGWSIHKSESDLNNFIPRVYGAFERILRHCGLSPLVSEGHGKGRDRNYDFIVTQRGAPYRVVRCLTCDYTADQQVAVGVSTVGYGKLMPLKEGGRTDVDDYSDIGRIIGVPNSRVATCRVFSTKAGFVMAVYRADHELSLVKLGRLIEAPIVAQLQDEDLVELGFVAGFVSPLGKDLDRMSELGIGIVVDPLVAETQNLVIAGNEKGLYFVNANFGRDFEGHMVGDISLIDDRHRCYHCGGELRLLHALRLGNIARRNKDLSARMQFSVKGQDGSTIEPCIGSYWFALDALVAGVVHVFQDKRGIVWPMQLAPHKCVMIVVGKSETLRKVAESIHENMNELMLWDERPMSFSERLNDANRMGIPVRVIVSSQTLQTKTVAVLYRRDGSSRNVAVAKLKAEILEMWKAERELARSN